VTTSLVPSEAPATATAAVPAPASATSDTADAAADTSAGTGVDTALDNTVDTAVDGGEWVEPAAQSVAEAVVRDARDFGVYARTGGWAFALKVARSVRPGGQPAEGTEKVSAKAFAELAGCSAERVMRYYKAWDMAADDGLVPQFEALVPGEDVELPEADVWLSYYSSRNSATSVRGRAGDERSEAGAAGA